MFGSTLVLGEEPYEVAGIFRCRPVRPLDFYRRQRCTLLYDEIDFGAVAAPFIVKASRTPVLKAFPELHAHPLFKNGSGVGPDDVGRGSESGGCMANAYVEEEKLGC